MSIERLQFINNAIVREVMDTVREWKKMGNGFVDMMSEVKSIYKSFKDTYRLFDITLDGYDIDPEIIVTTNEKGIFVTMSLLHIIEKEDTSCVVEIIEIDFNSSDGPKKTFKHLLKELKQIIV